ncbi:MAG: methyltransferase domain-containing protein [Candidatus Eremiobacteraeota bacterium]|nr:methyltransferase domain-containing protein [Candidatus Eremiobacteraeota bacterium]
MTDLNPQAKQMADESMVRNLAAQARAIWPQEVPLLQRYALPRDARILDAGCGTGEASWRLAELFPHAHVFGVDIIDAHLELARSRHAAFAPRLTFAHQSIYELDEPAASFDLVVCRHVLHSIPFPDRVITELARVTKPGGYLHFIPEDYRMLHFQRSVLDPSDFWHAAPLAYGDKTNTDLFIGRDIVPMLTVMELDDIAMDYIIVDTLRAREDFATILQAWRDGYVDSIAELTSFTRAQADAYFAQMIINVRDPLGYAVWMVPVASARLPRAR